ncbi:MAG: serine/threonine protein kinase [Bifidobacteriaceae bacterium]|jgi:hypothetical protein|nr:serine/threonine protein kinase [Bifidobacteriaceae bacterium]
MSFEEAPLDGPPEQPEPRHLAPMPFAPDGATITPGGATLTPGTPGTPSSPGTPTGTPTGTDSADSDNPAPTPDPEDTPTQLRPQIIPGIELIEEIGHGGFGTVYRAWQTSVGREVAVKLHQRRIQSDSVRHDFMREITAAGQVSAHPGIVSVYDGGITTDGRPYIVMELCPAGSLWQTVARSGPLTPEAVIEVGIQIADALAAAHAAGIVHRDVKPGNILITQFGKLALADFGLASLPANWGVASMSQAALTPTYAPPEAFRGGKPTPAWDVYSLGATLYALLAGRPPRWSEDGPPSLEQMVLLSAEPLPHLPTPPPQSLWDAITWATYPDPAGRAPSAAALRDALAAARDGLPHRIPQALGPSLDAVPVPAFAPAAQPRRSHKKLVAGLVATAVVLGLGGGGLAWALATRDKPDVTATDDDAAADAAGSPTEVAGPRETPADGGDAGAEATEGAETSPVPADEPVYQEELAPVGTCYLPGVINNGVPATAPQVIECGQSEWGDWESYGTGILAEDAERIDLSVIMADSAFYEQCSATKLYEYVAAQVPDGGWSDDVGWEVTAWGPTDLDFLDGSRAFTCAVFRCGGDRFTCPDQQYYPDLLMWPELKLYAPTGADTEEPAGVATQ